MFYNFLKIKDKSFNYIKNGKFIKYNKTFNGIVIKK